MAQIAHRDLRDPMRFRIINRAGDVLWLVVFAGWLKDGERPALHLTCHDITASIRSEEALSQSEARLQTIFSTMSEGVALNEGIFDEHGDMIDSRSAPRASAWSCTNNCTTRSDSRPSVASPAAWPTTSTTF